MQELLFQMFTITTANLVFTVTLFIYLLLLLLLLSLLLLLLLLSFFYSYFFISQDSIEHSIYRKM